MSLPGLAISREEITEADAELLLGLAQPSGDCWIIPGGNELEYRAFYTASGRQLAAHRAAYAAWVGPVPAGLMVCHHCDRPRCIRPEHLFLGTASTNQRDRFAKGRYITHPLTIAAYSSRLFGISRQAVQEFFRGGRKK